MRALIARGKLRITKLRGGEGALLWCATNRFSRSYSDRNTGIDACAPVEDFASSFSFLGKKRTVQSTGARYGDTRLKRGFPLSSSFQSAEVSENTESLPEWKQEIKGRLAAHRTRRGGSRDEQPTLPGIEPPARDAEPASVAARVAERYSKAPTYGEMIAAEAAKAARAAEAAAEAARQAQAAAQAVTDVLCAGAELEAAAEESQRDEDVAPAFPTGQYRVHPASLPALRPSQITPRASQAEPVEPHPHVVDPFEEALVAPAQPLPARVLEFPRELVAARKARPRVAEGPLRETGAEPEKSQLRIFEVEPETISREPIPAPGAVDETGLGGWSTIRLDAAPRMMETEMAASSTTAKPARTASARAAGNDAPFSSRAGRSAQGRASLLGDVLHVAPMGDRLLAAMVDAALVACALAMFIAVFVACTAHPPSGRPAMIAAAAALVGFLSLYQWLFFTFAESTPGMRFAKIALCTFGDENPGRKTLQHRVGALFLAALPLGLGFLWALLDDDRLGWHDRMTRTYQRSYRKDS